MPFGRPTKYSPELQEKADKYANRFQTDNDNPSPMDIPFIEEVALLLDIDESTVWAWSRAKYPQNHEDEELRGKLKYPDFSKTIKRVNDLQKVGLKRLTFDRDAKIGAIFQLKCNHSMVETSRQELTGPGGGPIHTKNEGVIVLPQLVEPDKPKK